MEHGSNNRAGELVLLFPTSSLISQISQYVQRNPRLGLTICRSLLSASRQRAFAQANIAIADATEEPQAACEAFENARATLGPLRVSAYSEVMHTGLELFVRARGALLLGQMTMEQWDDYFQSMLRQSRRPARFFKLPASFNRTRPDGEAAGTHPSRHGYAGGVCTEKEISI